jgi:hypothetical protein
MEVTDMSNGLSRDPHALTSAELARRLAELAGEERQAQVDFLLQLDAFDQRKAWLEAGYGSLWAYCLEVLHLGESAAGRRTRAMRILRRFPSLEAPLRDGRLCLSTLCALGPVLTDDDLAGLVERAAFLSEAETERLVVSIQPRSAPADGVRRIATAASAAAPATAPMAVACTADVTPKAAFPLELTPLPASRPELRPVSADTYSLRVTLDAACKAELDQLVSLLSHKTKGNLAEVLREAIRCAIAKHGKRRGAVAPERKRNDAGRAPPAADPRAVSMELKREVWDRDGGRCAWVSPDGKRCGSTWMLEIGHLTPAALGRMPTLDDLQLQCRAHNLHDAVRFFGAEHMAPYVGGLDPRAGRGAGRGGIAPGSGRDGAATGPPPAT